MQPRHALDCYPTGAISEADLDDLFPVQDSEHHAPSDTTAIAELGALKLWQTEIHEEKRTKYDFDALFRAACAEAHARDAVRQGDISMANEYRREADRIMLEDYIGEAA